VSKREKMPSGRVELFSPSMVRMNSAMACYGEDIYGARTVTRKLFLLRILIGVRFAPDATPMYQKSAVYSTEDTSSHSHEPHLFCFLSLSAAGMKLIIY
jgi:hypothetical protein